MNLKQTYPYEVAASEHGKIIDFMKQEDVKVFELNQILEDILKEASIKDKKEIITRVWGEEKNRPEPEEVKAEHLVDGYPSRPFFDEEKDTLHLPEKQRGSIYTRDISFMTQAGLIVSKMKYESRWEQPKIAKIAFNYHPELKDNIKATICANASPRHVPSKILAVSDIPYTLNMKKVEIAVRKVIHGEPVHNKDALRNPEVLNFYDGLLELQEE